MDYYLLCIILYEYAIAIPCECGKSNVPNWLNQLVMKMKWKCYSKIYFGCHIKLPSINSSKNHRLNFATDI